MCKAKVKILIAANPANHEGGVVNYYNTLLRHFDDPELELCRVNFGSRMEFFYLPHWCKGLLYPFYFLWDLLRLCFLLLGQRRIRIVQVSPSLIPVPLFRDGIILLMARLFRRKRIVFFRGWKKEVYARIAASGWRRRLFNFIFGRCDLTIVLLSEAERDLAALNYPGKVVRTTTLYEKSAVLPVADRHGQKTRFLFLGRVSELKGIGDLLEAVALMRANPDSYEVIIAGHEYLQGEIAGFQQKAAELGITEKVKFVGRLDGLEKQKMYADSDIFVFPSWTEGCPNSVLEAMGNGLFIIGTRVGALPDLLTSERYGVLVDAHSPCQLATEMDRAIPKIAEIREQKAEIRAYAEQSFDASCCADFLLRYYLEMAEDESER